MRRSQNLFLSLAVAALASGCPSSSASLPEITAFTATPPTISAGGSSTLEWTVTNASQVSLDSTPASSGLGVQTGNSLVVTPATTTKYTLTATGLGGTTTADVTVTVGTGVAKPVITAFTASPSDVATGSSSTLSWTVTGTVTALSLGDGSANAPKDETGKTSDTVTPSAQTTYTLTATNNGGSTTATATVSVHSPSLRLQYTDPGSTTAKLLVVKNAASTNNRLVLDVKVGSAPITAFGLAMNIPFAATFTNNATNGIAVDGNLSPPGLIAGTINYGASPSTGAVLLGGTAMPNFISVGVAKHKATAGDGDDTWAANAVLFSIAIKMVGSPAPGNVFLGSGFSTNASFRAAALHKDGTEAVGKADIALGDLIVSL